MRSLKRNQSTVFYSLKSETKDTFDKNGNPIYSYSEPIKDSFTLSPNTGEAEMQPFGRDVDYDRNMITHDMECKIDEFSRLWIDKDPLTESHNYIVKKVAKSLNCIKYAIKEVNTSK